MNMTLPYPRRIEPRIVRALQDTPVVLLAGPRQAGKKTLVRQIAAQFAAFGAHRFPTQAGKPDGARDGFFTIAIVDFAHR
ncbi:hypothetical protein B9N43_11840 [Denitratisoma sp. DHT3]|nr:hypothetical protein B9N43_11840 [Denitratisoma sp. DHT3]